MKRYVSLICIFCLLVMFVAKPISVSAASFDPVQSPMIDLLDLQDNKPVLPDINDDYFRFKLNVNNLMVGYIEFLFFTNADVTSVSVDGLECDFIREGLFYRAFCKPNRDYSVMNLYILFEGTSRACALISAQFNSAAHSHVYSVSTEIESLITQEPFLYYYNGSAVSIPTTDNDFLNTDFRLRFYIDNYKFYDYINFSLKFFVSSITSVTAGIGDTLLVPFDITYIENPSADVDNDDRFNYFVKICLDLSDLDLSLYDYPITVSVSGVVEDLADSNYYYCTVLNISGFILSYDYNPIIFWFRKTYHGLNTWFDSLLDVLQNVYNGNTVPGKSFQHQVNQKDQQLEDMAAVMESVEQPDLNSVNVSANTYVDGTVLAASMSGITSVFSQGLFFDLIVMSIMMATAGYVLFGKR